MVARKGTKWLTMICKILHQKTNDWATRTLLKTVSEVRCSGQVSNCFSPTCNRRITVLPWYGLSAIHYNITKMISFQVKLLLWVTKHGTCVPCLVTQNNNLLCKICRVCMVMVFNAIIENISAISWGVSFIGRMKPGYPVKSTVL
jgi:hypothetical protein